MQRRFAAAALTLSVLSACAVATAGVLAMAADGDRPAQTGSASGAAVATGQDAAIVPLHGGDPKDGAALEVIARPVTGKEASAPYLVGVFVSDDTPGKPATRLLGSFSFFPPRAGQAQTFVIPKPQAADAWLAKGAKLSIKLIPANPDSDIKGAAVEILGARVVK